VVGAPFPGCSELGGLRPLEGENERRFPCSLTTCRCGERAREPGSRERCPGSHERNPNSADRSPRCPEHTEVLEHGEQSQLLAVCGRTHSRCDHNPAWVEPWHARSQPTGTSVRFPRRGRRGRSVSPWPWIGRGNSVFAAQNPSPQSRAHRSSSHAGSRGGGGCTKHCGIAVGDRFRNPHPGTTRQASLRLLTAGTAVASSNPPPSSAMVLLRTNWRREKKCFPDVPGGTTAAALQCTPKPVTAESLTRCDSRFAGGAAVG